MGVWLLLFFLAALGFIYTIPFLNHVVTLIIFVSAELHRSGQHMLQQCAITFVLSTNLDNHVCPVFYF